MNVRKKQGLGHICEVVLCFYEAVAFGKCQMHRNSLIKLGLLNIWSRLEVFIYTRKKTPVVLNLLLNIVFKTGAGEVTDTSWRFSHSEAATVALASGFR